MFKKILLIIGSVGAIASTTTFVAACGTKTEIKEFKELLEKQDHDQTYDHHSVGGDKPGNREIQYNLVDMQDMNEVLTAAEDILVHPKGPSIVVLSTSACPYCRTLLAGHKAGDVKYEDYHGLITDSLLYEELNQSKYINYKVWIIEDKAPGDHQLPWTKERNEESMSKLWLDMFKAIGWKFQKDSAAGQMRQNGMYRMENYSTPIVIKTASDGRFLKLMSIS